jgi:hypothetical protein
MEKFLTNKKLPGKSSKPIRYRRYAFPGPEISGEDILNRQLEQTNEEEEARKITGKNPHS